MRRAAPLVLATAAVLALGAAPAAAKEGYTPPEATASIAGPGLDGPIVLQGRAVWRMLYLTTFRGYNLPFAQAPARDRRGPRYEVTYYATYPGESVRILHQDLYPYGPGDAAWAFTPSGQPSFDNPVGGEVQSGWWHSVALLDRLSGWGLPARDVSERKAREADAGHLTGLWAGLGALLILGGTVSVVRRGRRATGDRS